MGQPVVHFEIIGADPEALRGFYGELFGWEFDTSSPVSGAVSEPTNYGFATQSTTSDAIGIPGGVGGGSGYDHHAIFYVSVPDVEAALQKPSVSAAPERWGPIKPRRASSSVISPTPKAPWSASQRSSHRSWQTRRHAARRPGPGGQPRRPTALYSILGARWLARG